MKENVKIHYYDTFRCTADKCPYTCCQEWAITIDEETKSKWEGKTLGDKVLHDYLDTRDEKSHMALDENKKCPFLSENHLCQMVVDFGETYLSCICKTYPRHINTFEGWNEYSLDFGCPAVIDLLYATQGSITLSGNSDDLAGDHVLYHIRKDVMSWMKDTRFSLTERMLMTYYCLLDMLEQEDVSLHTLDTYKEENYRVELVNEIRKVDIDSVESFWERNEFFRDIVQLYRKEENYSGYLDVISEWADNLETYYSDVEIEQKLNVFLQHLKPFEKLMENYLVAEIWAGMLKEGIALDESIMVFQWIVLEYCTIKHALYLKWLAEDETTLNYETVRDYIMIVSRMSGYDASEIRNCLELSFEESIIDWGHFALLLGNSTL